MRFAAVVLTAASLLACDGAVAPTSSDPAAGGDAEHAAPADDLISGCYGEGLVGGIQPDVPVDYLGFRTETRGRSGASVEILHETGAPCATATDEAACRAKVDTHRVLGDHCDLQDCNAHYYVYTRGDEVGFATFDGGGVYALMGRVDTPAEAFMTATWREGYQASCRSAFAPPRYAARADGWDVEMERSECTAVEGEKLTYRALVHVSTSGVVTERSRVLVDRKTGGPECVPMTLLDP